MEGNETEMETVLRETREEVDITDLSFIEGFRHRISYYYRRAGQTVFKEVIFYLLEAKTDSVRLSREHVGFDWLPFDRAYERLTFKNAKETIKRARDYLVTSEQRNLPGFTEESA
jgi:8-oxo-dGTP pyrophosphatase MutT (NUDIX family)